MIAADRPVLLSVTDGNARGRGWRFLLKPRLRPQQSGTAKGLKAAAWDYALVEWQEVRVWTMVRCQS